MFIKWNGQRARVNSFGSFTPGKVYEVPKHIGLELLKVALFREVDIEEVNLKLSNLSKEQLISRWEVLYADYTHLQKKYAELETLVGAPLVDTAATFVEDSMDFEESTEPAPGDTAGVEVAQDTEGSTESTFNEQS